MSCSTRQSIWERSQVSITSMKATRHHPIAGTDGALTAGTSGGKTAFHSLLFSTGRLSGDMGHFGAWDPPVDKICCYLIREGFPVHRAFKVSIALL